MSVGVAAFSSFTQSIGLSIIKNTRISFFPIGFSFPTFTFPSHSSSSTELSTTQCSSFVPTNSLCSLGSISRSPYHSAISASLFTIIVVEF